MNLKTCMQVRKTKNGGWKNKDEKMKIRKIKNRNRVRKKINGRMTTLRINRLCNSDHKAGNSGFPAAQPAGSLRTPGSFCWAKTIRTSENRSSGRAHASMMNQKKPRRERSHHLSDQDRNRCLISFWQLFSLPELFWQFSFLPSIFPYLLQSDR